MVSWVSSIALDVQQLAKAYRGKPAVRDVSFSAKFGEVTAVLGPNGAGKTTTIECCEGLRVPDRGQIKILGSDPRVAPAAVRSRIGVMLQDGGLPMAAPAAAVLRHVGRLYGDRERIRERELVEQLELGDHLKTMVRRLSGGNRQRLALACALIGDPEVLFLDEPTAGMDAYARVGVHNLIREIKARGTAIILTTHLLDEAESLADQVILMAGGQIESSGTVAQVTASGGEGLEIKTRALGGASIEDDAGDTAGLSAALGSKYTVERGEGRDLSPEADKTWQISPAPDPEAFARAATWFAQAGHQIEQVSPLNDLTSLFLKLADENGGK